MHQVKQNEIRFDLVKLQNSTENAYTLFCCAKDLYLGTRNVAVKDLADKYLIAPETFKLICSAMAIRRCGLSALESMKRGDRQC